MLLKFLFAPSSAYTYVPREVARAHRVPLVPLVSIVLWSSCSGGACLPLFCARWRLALVTHGGRCYAHTVTHTDSQRGHAPKDT